MLHGGGVMIEHGEGTEAAVVVVANQEMFVPITMDHIRSGGDRFAFNLPGRGCDHLGPDPDPGGEEGQGRLHQGSWRAAPDDPGGKGLGKWRDSLARVGCDVLDLNLAEDEVPDDLTLLMVVGPVDPFKPNEVAKLRAYANRGGPALLLLGNAGPSGLEEFLKSNNLEILPGVVIDPRLNYRGTVRVVLAPTRDAMPHPISSAMDPTRYVILDSAAPIQILGEPRPGGATTEPVNRSLVPTVILRSSRYAWGETDPRNPNSTFDSSVDSPWPKVGVAVARRAAPSRPGEPVDEKPRLVLFSCPTMADNQFQDVALSNLDILMNAASWLRGRPDSLGIAPKTHVAMTLAVDETLRSRLIMVPSATAVMLIIAMGITVYVARRE